MKQEKQILYDDENVAMFVENIKGWTKCKKCRELSNTERYDNLPFKEWDEITPVYSEMGNEYFFDIDSIDEYCDEYGFHPKDLQLVLCKPQYFTTIESDHWCDIMPGDIDELPKELQQALDALNKVIEKLPPASYCPSRIRTDYIFNVNRKY